MSRNIALWLALLGMFFMLGAQAASDAEFPTGWESWPVKGDTGVIPDNKTPIPSDLPPIIQELVKTYNWVGDGKGSKYQIRINPSQEQNYKARNGKYDDGAIAVLELTDIGVILVTEHLLGEPQYGTYSVDGKDLSDAHPSLSPATCNKCHTGYGEACVTGVCSQR